MGRREVRRWQTSGQNEAVKTDSLFYRLFQLWPELALDLAGVATPDVERYTFRSEEQANGVSAGWGIDSAGRE